MKYGCNDVGYKISSPWKIDMTGDTSFFRILRGGSEALVTQVLSSFPTDIIRHNGDTIQVLIDLAGVGEDHISLEVEKTKDGSILRGTVNTTDYKKPPAMILEEEQKKVYLYRRRNKGYGEFVISFSFPIKLPVVAELKDGLLTITIPENTPEKTTIKVNVTT